MNNIGVECERKEQMMISIIIRAQSVRSAQHSSKDELKMDPNWM